MMNSKQKSQLWRPQSSLIHTMPTGSRVVPSVLRFPSHYSSSWLQNTSLPPMITEKRETMCHPRKQKHLQANRKWNKLLELSMQIIRVPNASHWGIFFQSIGRLESYWCLATVMVDWLSVWLYRKWWGPSSIPAEFRTVPSQMSTKH